LRIAHITDVHVQRPPRPRELFSKRLLGSANLYLAGRRRHFTAAVQSALVEAVAAQAPDALICTGDLTAQATVGEFRAAHDLLAPLFARQPTALITGNHDTYTRAAWREARMEGAFGRWMGQGAWPRVHDLGGGVAAVAIDVCEARLDSAGRVGEDQLVRLRALLEGDALAGRFVFAMLHYPLRDRRGAPYGPARRALFGARALEAALTGATDRVGAIVHGHEHHGFRAELPSPGGPIPILNPGSSGYAWLPEARRTAHFNVYTVTDGALTDVERLRYDGEVGAFGPEPGGAYATGG